MNKEEYVRLHVKSVMKKYHVLEDMLGDENLPVRYFDMLQDIEILLNLFDNEER